MSQRTYTTLQQTVNLIGGLIGMAAVVKGALGLGFGSLIGAFIGALMGITARFASDSTSHRDDLSVARPAMTGRPPLDGISIKRQRGEKCSLRFSAAFTQG